jgi:hypothetical protein
VVHHFLEAGGGHIRECFALFWVISEGAQVEDDPEESVFVLDESQIPLMR